MAVYVFDRTAGGLYHRPFYGGYREVLHETHCGLTAASITTMSEHWAQHTGLQPCAVCFADRLPAPGPPLHPGAGG